MSTIRTTYQLRAYLAKGGHVRLDAAMRECATLYNAALQNRRDAYAVHVGWEHTKDVDGNRMLSRDGERHLYNDVRSVRSDSKSVTLYDQTKEFTDVRRDIPEWGAYDVGVGRGVLRRLDHAYNAFFRRVKAGDRPGFPRFKSGRRWRTIDVAQARSSMVKVAEHGRKAWLRVKGLPTIELRLKRPLPPSEQLKTLRIVRYPTGVYVDLGYEVEHEPLPALTNAVGLDFGVNTRIATSDGELIDSRPAGRKSRGGRRYPAVATATKHHANGTSPDGIPVIASQGIAPDALDPTNWERGSASPCAIAPDALDPTVEPLPCRDGGGVAPDALEPTVTATSLPSARQVAPDALERTALDSASPYANLERRIARCKRHSNNQRKLYRQLARIRHRDRIRNRNHCHRITTGLVRYYGRIAVEKLIIPNMVRSAAGTPEEPGTNVAAKSGLNREIQSATWGLLREQLRYKAEWAGREFVEVNPRYTSRECWACGHQTPQSVYRTYRCGVCGTSIDRDINAALNVLQRAWPDATGAGISPALFGAVTTA